MKKRQNFYLKILFFLTISSAFVKTEISKCCSFQIEVYEVLLNCIFSDDLNHTNEQGGDKSEKTGDTPLIPKIIF